MDLLLCTYPLFLTYNYYQTPIPNSDSDSELPFLVAWWSTFGSLSLMENYAGLHNLPLYSFAKGGILLSMYSKDYRAWMMNHAFEGVKRIASEGKDVGLSIIDEHCPSLKQYVNLGNNNNPGKDTSWFEWVGWSKKKSVR